MKKTLAVMRYEIRATLGRKAFTILALGLPLLLGAIALVVVALNRDRGAVPDATGTTQETSPSRPAVEGYVDEGGLIQTLPDDVPSGRLRRYVDDAAAQAALEADEISAYYIIPADYLESGDVTYVRLDYDPLSDERCDHDWIEWVLLVNLFGGDQEAAAEVWRPLDVQWQRAPSPQKSDDGADAENWIVNLLPNLMAFSLYIAIIIPSGTLMAAVTDEKKNRVMEVLMSSLAPGQMITGKILALGVLGLLQITLWVGILWAVVRFGGQPLSIPPGFSVPTKLLVCAFVYCLLGYGMYGAQMAGAGALAPDIKDTRGAAFVVMLPLIIVYVFLMVIVERPDSPLAIVFSLFPLTSPVGMIARMAATDVPLWQPALAAVLQLLTAILIVRLTTRLFRAQTLLSGQPFSLKRFGSALLDRT